jgi:arylsulfatase A-like enzyme
MDCGFSKGGGDHPRQPHPIDSMAEVGRMFDGYDTGVLYADTHVGRLLEELDRQGVLDETSVIVSADHGEGLGELNAYGAHCFADHPTARVPLIVRWAGPGGTGPEAVKSRASPTVDSALRYQFDLAATVLDLLGIAVPDSWDARSFAGAIEGEGGEGDPGRDSLVLSNLAQSCQRCVRWRHAGRELLYMRTYHPGYHAIPEEALFDVAADPHELENLADGEHGALEEARGLLEQWRNEALVRSASPDPIEVVLAEGPEMAGGVHDRYRKRLRETGRSVWAKRFSEGGRPCG